MDDNLSYAEKLIRDLLWQFHDKPNIEIFQKALARQLDALHAFFIELLTLRWLNTAVGVQLDGIGDIVVLSRAEALVLSQLAGLNVPMDDDTYRRYLAWKIALNTSDCTHTDVYNALRMFWDTPLFYSEDINHPATIIFNTPDLTPRDNVGLLFVAPKVKAAGVALVILATTVTPLDPLIVRVGGAVFKGIMTTRLPQWLPVQEYEQDINIKSRSESVTTTELNPALYTWNAVVQNDAIGKQDAELMLADGTAVNARLQIERE